MALFRTCAVALHSFGSLFAGRVRTSCVLWSRWEQRKNWNARYFVLYRGHWFVFKNRSDYEERGLHGCVASLSLIMNRFQIDLDATRNTRFALTVGDWFCLLVDTGIEKQDRGAWVIHFLAYQNKVSCFPAQDSARHGDVKSTTRGFGFPLEMVRTRELLFGDCGTFRVRLFVNGSPG